MSTTAFDGEQRLNRDEIDGLRRVVRILHAVMVGQDYSGATLGNWWGVGRKKFDLALGLETDNYRELRRLVSLTAQFGLQVDCEKIVNELADLWSRGGRNAQPEQIRLWIKKFHPIALSFPNHESMRNVFEQARTLVSNVDLV
jgi:hypothetical protein